ncbi:MAG: hypothetical protein IT372_41300 [Polyangiaceae bacterium]|nr:hypothetical protein [Polyangiaceae bacterium]
MAARFVDKQEVRSVAQLSKLQAEQLRLAGKAYDGEDLPVEARLAGDEPEHEEGSFLGFCNLYKVVDGDRHLYDAWIYMVDSGTIFRAGTTEKVAEIIQFGLECDDPVIRMALGPAMVEARLLPRGDSSYTEFAEALARQEA